MSIYQKLMAIQQELKVPKSQYNKFGNFYYRNLDDILQALKPLLKEHNMLLFMTDDVREIAGRFYIEATAVLMDLDDGNEIKVHGYAREANQKSGMDDAQITGACSSYARKYALGGLFDLDDGADPDAMDNSGSSNNQTGQQNTPPKGQNSPQNGQRGGNNSSLSGAQIGRAKTKARVANLSDADVKNWIQKKFKKNTLESLTKAEYDELCSALDSASTKVVNDVPYEEGWRNESLNG